MKKESIDVRKGLPNHQIHVVNEKMIKLIKESGIKYSWAMVGFIKKENKFIPQFEGIVVSKKSIGLKNNEELERNNPKYLKRKEIIKLKSNPDFDLNDLDDRKEALEDFLRNLIIDQSDYAISKDNLENYSEVLIGAVNPVYFNLNDFIEKVASDKVEKLYKLYVKKMKLLSDDEFIELMLGNSVIDHEYAITGSKTNELSRASLGELEIQTAYISGEVNGKASKDIVKELMTNLSDKDLDDVARQLDASWNPKKDWKYIYKDMGYDHAVLYVDEEELEKAISDKFDEEE
jgi:hypothetical protein